MRLRLKVEAPVRVGGREQQVNKLEFVRHDGKLHAVSPRKLAGLFQSKSERALDDWNTQVLTRGQNADLTTFLRGESLLSSEAVEEVSRYSAFCEDQNLRHPFQPHARDAFGKLFIPGSAIKGAIRAAVLWRLVDKEEANRYVSRTNEKKGSFAQKLNEQTLQSYRLPHQGGTKVHRDLMRAVKVSDAHDGELRSRVENVVIQTYAEDRGRRTAARGASPVYVECLAPGSWVQFDLKVDQKILGDFQSENEALPFRNETDLLAIVRNFYAEVWRFEQQYYGVAAVESEEPEPVAEEPEEFPTLEEWIRQEKGITEKLGKNQQNWYRSEYNTARRDFEAGDEANGKQGQSAGSDVGVRDGEIKVGKIKDFYAGDSYDFRLGWGSGLMSTTVDMRLDDENMGKVLNLVEWKHHDGRPIEGPKSRKLVGSENAPRWPMGWARLEEMR